MFKITPVIEKYPLQCLTLIYNKNKNIYRIKKKRKFDKFKIDLHSSQLMQGLSAFTQSAI